MAQKWIESDVEFSFPDDVVLTPHDRVPGDGNTFWPGVDARIDDGGDHVWLEVKNFRLSRVPPRRRGGQWRRFASEAKSTRLAAELRAKFLGTTAFLAWRGQLPSGRTTYAVLLEPPRPVDVALLLTLGQTLGSQIPAKACRPADVGVVVLDLAHWNQLYSDFEAKAL